MKDSEIHWGVCVRRTDGSYFLATNGHGVIALFNRRKGALDFIKELSAPISKTNPKPHIQRRRMSSIKLRVKIDIV